MTNHSHSSGISAAIESDLRGETNIEGRSGLDFLISQLASQSDVERACWKDAAVTLARESAAKPFLWWTAFERLVVLADLVGARLGGVLEELIAKKEPTDPCSRGVCYSLLDGCGKAPPAAQIFADEELRSADFLRWLDLTIAHLPQPMDVQEILLDASRVGRFSLDNFIQRLDEMREVGGRRFPSWLKAYRATLNDLETQQFDQIVDEAYGLAALNSKASHVATWEAKDAARLPWKDSTACLALLQKATSFNHSKLVQFYYLSAEKHRNLKDAFQKRRREPKAIAALAEELLNYSNSELFSAVNRNFSYLHTYFLNKTQSAPRICLKGNYFVDSSNTIVSIFRDHTVPYSSDTAIEHNTGFYSIQNSGKYFVENNIPEAALLRHYVNPRLDQAAIFAAADKLAPAEAVKSITENWSKYWKDSNVGQDSDSFYKSTMILPLTLLDNEISPEFLENTKVRIPDVDRSVFGFLCFDHTQVEYFDEQSDLFFGKIFADVLCTYVFVRMLFLDLSSTFAQVQSFLGKNQLPLKVHKLSKNQKDSITSQRPLVRAGEMEELMSPPLALPEPPKMVRTDSELLNFVRPPKGRSTRWK